MLISILWKKVVVYVKHRPFIHIDIVVKIYFFTK